MAEPQAWNVELTDEYIAWFEALDEGMQDAVRDDMECLRELALFWVGHTWIQSKAQSIRI
jgi:hypothetical protein